MASLSTLFPRKKKKVRILPTDFRATSRILIADDNEKTAKHIGSILQVNGYQNVCIKSKFTNFAELDNYDVVIIDIMWITVGSKPQGETNYFGLSCLNYLKTSYPECKVVLMSIATYDLNNLSAIANADGYFTLPEDFYKFEPITIINIVGSLLDPTKDKYKNINKESDSFVNNADDIYISIPVKRRNDLYKIVSVLEIALANGKSGDSFGMEQNDYEDLIYDTRQMKIESQKHHIDNEIWKKRMENMSYIAVNAGNIVKLIEKIGEHFH